MSKLINFKVVVETNTGMSKSHPHWDYPENIFSAAKRDVETTEEALKEAASDNKAYSNMRVVSVHIEIEKLELDLA